MYGSGGQEQATSLDPAQEVESTPIEQTTTPAESTAPTDVVGAAGNPKPKPKPQPASNEEDNRGRYDAVATVSDVVDGDTIEVEPAMDSEEEMRLIGVDTPETKDPEEGVEPFGKEASNFTTSVLEGEEVELEFDAEKEDLYGRVLAYV